MIRVLEFKTEYRSGGRPPLDWVLLAPLGVDGEKSQTWRRVCKCIPPEDADETLKESLYYQDMAAKWSVIGPAYEAWTKGQEIPDDGTPLEAWSGVSVEQAKFLKSLGIRTVEDVRDMNEATVERVRFPNARKLPGLAKSWLEGAAVAEKEQEIADMKEKMAAMEALLEESLNASKAKPEEAKAAPKRRGRPPKKQETEAA